MTETDLVWSFALHVTEWTAHIWEIHSLNSLGHAICHLVRRIRIDNQQLDVASEVSNHHLEGLRNDIDAIPAKFTLCYNELPNSLWNI